MTKTTTKTTTTTTMTATPTSNKSNRRVVKSKLYNSLNTEDSVLITTADSTRAGVRIEEVGNKQGIEVELLIPIVNNNNDEGVLRLSISGRQARALYTSLNRFYSERD